MENSNQPKTIEDKLKLMREGYAASLVISYGTLKIPVKMLTAVDESSIITQAKINAKKKMTGVADELDRQMIESSEVMKEILFQGSTVDSFSFLPKELLDQLSSHELSALYDSYYDIIAQVSPEFETLTPIEIEEIIIEVKKNPTALKDLSTRQLKGIGLHFLEKILPLVKGLGS